MGYDVHITRARDWSDNHGKWIAAEEWLDVVRNDPELKIAGHNGEHFALWSGRSEYSEPWLDWFEGNLYSKNPDIPLRRKMFEIAQRLNARVQGDDGEEYDERGEQKRDSRAGRSVRRPAQALWGRLKGWLGGHRSDYAAAPRFEAPSFKVGDRVKNSVGLLHTVTEIDPKANYGYGRIAVRRDDGQVIYYAFFGYDLTLVTDEDQ